MVVDLDLRRLRYFTVVAEELHFGRAAERLLVAQPALSQQIRGLESSLGIELFHRTTRVVSLTPAGERFLAYARRTLSETDRAVAEARRIASGEAGRIRVGFIGSATYKLMPDIARLLRTELPEVHLELLGDQMSPPLARALRHDDLDLAILRPCPELSGLPQRQLDQEEFLVAVPTDHRLAGQTAIRVTDLADEGFVTYAPEHSVLGAELRQICRDAGFDPRIAAGVSETSTLITFVASGLGVALVPHGVTEISLPGVSYVPLLESPVIDLLAAWRTPEPLTARVVASIERILAERTPSGRPRARHHRDGRD